MSYMNTVNRALSALDQDLGPVKYRYVLGFVHTDTHVILRPSSVEWMMGNLNGLGGKMRSEDRSPQGAMQREFEEAMGIDPVWRPDWGFIGAIRGVDYTIHVYSAYMEQSAFEERFRMIEVYAIEDLEELDCVWDVPSMVRAAVGQNQFDDLQRFVLIRPTQEAADWED